MKKKEKANIQSWLWIGKATKDIGQHYLFTRKGSFMISDGNVYEKKREGETGKEPSGQDFFLELFIISVCALFWGGVLFWIFCKLV